MEGCYRRTISWDMSVHMGLFKRDGSMGFGVHLGRGTAGLAWLDDYHDNELH